MKKTFYQKSKLIDLSTFLKRGFTNKPLNAAYFAV